MPAARILKLPENCFQKIVVVYRSAFVTAVCFAKQVLQLAGGAD